MANTSSVSPVSTSTAVRTSPTHEEIAQRAHELWVRKGYPHGQDEQNWYEAEQQLSAEIVPGSPTSARPEELDTNDSFDAHETTYQDANAPLTETAPLSTKVERELKGFGRPADRSVTSANL